MPTQHCAPTRRHCAPHERTGRRREHLRTPTMLSFATTTSVASSRTITGAAKRGTTTRTRASSQHFCRNGLGVDARRARRFGDGCARARCDAMMVRCKVASEGVERRAWVRGGGRRRGDAGKRRSTHESGQESSFFVDTPKTTRERIVDMCEKGTGYFPAFVAAGAVLGLAAPGTVSWFRGDAVTHTASRCSRRNPLITALASTTAFLRVGSRSADAVA